MTERDSWNNEQTCIAITLYNFDNKICNDFDSVMKQINQYMSRNKLGNAPFLITSSGCNLEYDYRKLDKFCFPNKNKDISWFSSISELTKSKWNPDESTRDTKWKATKLFFQKKISELKTEIIIKQSILDDLKESLDNLTDSEEEEEDGEEEGEEGENEEKNNDDPIVKRAKILK